MIADASDSGKHPRRLATRSVPDRPFFLAGTARTGALATSLSPGKGLLRFLLPRLDDDRGRRVRSKGPRRVGSMNRCCDRDAGAAKMSGESVGWTGGWSEGLADVARRSETLERIAAETRRNRRCGESR